MAEAEVEYREEDSYLNYIKFKVKETGEDIIIATTRPELLPARWPWPSTQAIIGTGGWRACTPLFLR